MEHTKLPTDSLYKFIAIFGLVAVIGSQYAAFKVLETHWERLIAFMENVSDPDGSKYMMLRRFSETDSSDMDKYVQSLPPSERSAFIGAFRQHSDIELIEFPIKWGVRFGVAMIVFGFSMWYYKVQRHLDEILRKQALADHKHSVPRE